MEQQVTHFRTAPITPSEACVHLRVRKTPVASPSTSRVKPLRDIRRSKMREPSGRVFSGVNFFRDWYSSAACDKEATKSLREVGQRLYLSRIRIVVLNTWCPATCRREGVPTTLSRGSFGRCSGRSRALFKDLVKSRSNLEN